MRGSQVQILLPAHVFLFFENPRVGPAGGVPPSGPRPRVGGQGPSAIEGIVEDTPESDPPELGLSQRVLFWVKSRGLIFRKMLLTAVRGGDPRWPRRRPGLAGVLLSEVRSPLFTQVTAGERELQLGKVENLRVTARMLDGTCIPAHGVFSFWRQLGRPTRARGFTLGRELRQGCLIPTVAGGICQLTNSIYQVAKRSGCAILERHGHTRPIRNAAFGPGEDATVFWNYLDLRFKTERAVVLRVLLTKDELVVRLEAPGVD